MKLNNLVKASIFTSTAIGLGFAFLLVPNVEFISVTVFLSGITLGAIIGSIVGVSSIAIYSILNPLGSGLVYFPLLIGQIIAMAVIGIAGAMNKKILVNLPSKTLILFSGAIGGFCSIWYDGVTTISYPISIGYSIEESLVYSLGGLLFTVMHILSNVIIFSIVIPSYLNRIVK
tara:strand:+ start:460 stop:981 length:522 start_codon:yes stop_codon:yes gene_type:complete